MSTVPNRHYPATRIVALPTGRGFQAGHSRKARASVARSSSGNVSPSPNSVIGGQVYPFTSLPAARVQAPPNARPVVILPGFGNCAQDYLAPFGNDEQAIATHLKIRGWKVFVVPTERKDWVKVFRSLFTFGYWRTSLTTHPGYTWYLEKVRDTVKQALLETGAQQVDLVGHSAGGWLARAFLADPKYFNIIPGEDGGALDLSPADSAGSISSFDAEFEVRPNPYVRSIVTLGSPHFPAPEGTARDMTGGALTWVSKQYPGAFFSGQGVQYVCVGGRTVRGWRSPLPDDLSWTEKWQRSREPRTVLEYAHDSYKQVSGEGQGVEGDAVVPMHCMFLEGAVNIELAGVFHSMSRIGTFDEESGVAWYGSGSVVDQWLAALVADSAPSSRAGQQRMVESQSTTDLS